MLQDMEVSAIDSSGKGADHVSRRDPNTRTAHRVRVRASVQSRQVNSGSLGAT